MDIQAIWIIILSIATPIAGVVGFAIQIRQVEKMRLENEKLQLEILALKNAASAADGRIVKVTTDEIFKFGYGTGLESRAPPGVLRRSSGRPTLTKACANQLKENLVTLAVFSGLVIVVLYFLYDVYRLVIWLSAKF